MCVYSPSSCNVSVRTCYACVDMCVSVHTYIYISNHTNICGSISASCVCTGWRRLSRSPKLQIISHKRATKYMSPLWKMTCKDKGSYESSPPCTLLCVCISLSLCMCVYINTCTLSLFDLHLVCIPRCSRACVRVWWGACVCVCV